ncbi:MAG: site-specific integrase [Acidobacteria bacterium]|nr:site-specific integrase [Acidobacteriota bacterium]
MLQSLFPRAHRRFLSLPVLGPIADGFDDWLATNGYTLRSREDAIHMLSHVDANLRRHVTEIGNLTQPVLHDCWRHLIKTHRGHAGSVRALERYLAAKGLIAAGQPAATSSASILIEEYANYLHEVRGLASGTVSNHRHTAQCFLKHLNAKGIVLNGIQPSHLESYITKTDRHLSRGSLQRDISALRGFLRFLAIDGRAPEGLASQVDTPRLYRQEQLPRALPWETVRALLQCLDRTSAVGLRDYAMFLLVATYGLRSSEVVGITLDDIRWRQSSLRIQQPKTSSSLDLPLTNEVASAIVNHLKRTPPPSPYRNIFLRMRAPVGALEPTAVADAFRSLVRKSGLRIPFRSPHCLRHSVAVHLLKRGTPLKTIGDILGHRSARSTSTYLRLATGDLREVSLPVPGRGRQAKEGRR